MRNAHDTPRLPLWSGFFARHTDHDECRDGDWRRPAAIIRIFFYLYKNIRYPGHRKMLATGFIMTGPDHPEATTAIM